MSDDPLRSRLCAFIRAGVKARAISDHAGYVDLDLPAEIARGSKAAGPRVAARLNTAMDRIAQILGEAR